jgi:hypothetical protein
MASELPLDLCVDASSCIGAGSEVARCCRLAFAGGRDARALVARFPRLRRSYGQTSCRLLQSDITHRGAAAREAALGLSTMAAMAYAEARPTAYAS